VSSATGPAHAVTAVAPLLMVAAMDQSLAFYIQGLGFTLQNRQ